MLILGSNNKSFIESYEVIKLLVSTFCQMLDILTVVRQDIFLIMSCFKFSMPDYESIPLVVEILCAITRHGGDGPYYKLLSTIETHNKELDRGYYRNCFKVLHCTTAKLKNDPDEMYLSATDIEEFLASGDELAICKVNNKINDIIFLVSYVFPKEESSIIFRRNKLAAFHLLEIDRGMFEKLSTSFVEWCGNCLAGYYLYHGPDITESDAASEKSHMPARVIENLNILDNVFKKTIALRGTSLEIDASIESIIGVLIWKFEANKTEVLKFIEFQRYYFEFQHLFAIDFHTCVLLHSSDEEVVIPLVTLQDVIESSNPKESAFEAWTTNLSLALITEISRFTSIAPLFSPLLLKVAAFASTVLPDLICVFVKLIGAAASDKVTKILQIFLTLKLNNIDQRYSDLFIRILLEVRSNYKKKLAFFEEIYSKMDLIAFFKIAAGSQLMKTSLLFLEDALNSNDETNESVLVRETKTLQSVYESIDDDDLIFGLPIEPSMKYAMNIINRGNANYNQVKFNSGMFDAEITLSPKENLHCQKTNIIHSMIENGLMGMSSLASTGKIDGEGSQISNEDYEWAWKLNNWDIPVPATGLKPFEQFNEDILIYKTLKQIHDSPAISHKICQNSMLEVLSCENSNETEWLKSIACIASIGDAYQHKNSLACPFNSSTLWFEESNDLESTESILLARRSAFQIFIETNFTMSETIWMKSMIELVRYNSIARSSDRFLQKSLNSAMLLDEISETKFTSSHPDIQRRVKEISKYHSACTLWRQGETSIPVAMLKELNQMPQIYLDSMDHVSTLSLSPELINALLVEWMSKSRQELPSTLMKKYVNPSMGLLSRGDVDVSESTKIYQIFANFCERQLKSQSFRDDINKISSLITSRKAEIDELKSHYNKKAVKATEKVSIQRYYLKLKAQYSQDTRELEVLEANKSELSDKAIEFYLKSINNDINSEENASDMDENVDKFFALWLEYSEREQINKKIRKDLLALPMHKLISWCPQLVSRISQAPTEFQDSLQKLILNLCEAHPFHSLYNLFSLAKHESSSKLNPTSTKAAIQIWQKLKTGSKNQPILNEIEKFCDEAIKLAEVKVARGKCIQLDKPLTRGTTRTTDSSGSVCDYSWWLNSLPHIPPPTLELKIDLTLLYHDCPTFAMISPKIEIATSGLSLPKIATFLLNDGSTHKMLLKHGADDLRQDSIMEQVFEKVNQMFWKDKETRKRNLRIRTYKAIPLGPQNGIIQFVPNSMALIDVIKPYHLVMDKMKVETARERMKKCQGGAKATRLSVYDDIIDDKIEPVLRHFFFDTFTSPEAWFQSRILYTHGVAATSIVGYMLGLGDRHCNNILLDKETGEPIHIDLGVAFDQGKRLPIPETVPFRLTRDIVDGFGITGVEGTFRKSCEHSFRVLRQNKDHVIAILDVLRWDPLYSWTLSPLRKNKLQDDGDGEGEEATEVAEEVAPAQIHEDGSEAGRAISKVADKLVGGGLSVEATVRELIQEATNKENLAVIYCGWCPFFRITCSKKINIIYRN